jgi:hypothetical protein
MDTAAPGTNLYLSTLSEYAEALGGTLEIRVVFPRPRSDDYAIRNAAIATHPDDPKEIAEAPV